MVLFGNNFCGGKKLFLFELFIRGWGEKLFFKNQIL